MTAPVTRFSTITVYNSIVDSVSPTTLDNVKPFTFVEFLNYSKSLSNYLIDYTDYQKYLKRWNEVTSVKLTDLNAEISQQFIAFLKTVSLNYTTAEEKRYLSNINFNDPADLEIAIPFFVTKIKEVILYFAEKRDTYKINLLSIKEKGSIGGVSSTLKTFILETLFANDVDPQIALFQPLSSISNNIQIEIEEGFDAFNDYFDLDPFKEPSFYNASSARQEFFTANTNVNDPNLFLNEDQAIIDLLNSEKIVLAEIQDLIVTIGQADITLLQNKDFINYANRDRDNLSLLLNVELIKKFTGTDFFYLSTNANGDFLSGGLFQATSPWANLLNVHNPSTLTVPATSNSYERDVGLFFKPSNQSLLMLQTPFAYTVKGDLLANHVYIAPDPNIYGNISGVSKVDYETPFTFTPKSSLIQKNISSNNAIGNSFVTSNDLTWESYQSAEQYVETHKFLSGLYSKGIISQFSSDIYGNIVFGFKQQSTDWQARFVNNISLNVNPLSTSGGFTPTFTSSIKQLTAASFTGSSTTYETITGSNATESVTEKRNSIGNFMLYNISTDQVQSLSTAFLDVFQKYPTIAADLNTRLRSVDVLNDTFVLSTSSNFVVDKVAFTKSQFTRSTSIPVLLSTGVNNVVSNIFQVKNDIYFVHYYVVPDYLQNSNERPYRLDLYSYNLQTNTVTSHTFENSNVFVYDALTKLDIVNVLLTFNQKQNTFIAVVNLKDTNQCMFVHSIQFNVKADVILKANILYVPSNTNITINFYDDNFVDRLSYQSIYSIPSINNTNGTITF